MSPRYAAGTTVPVDRSRAELERVLVRYGATSFGYATEAAGASIAFVIGARRIKIRITFPSPEVFKETDRGKPRSEAAAQREWERAVRQRWRALVLIVRAKLEAVESGIASADDEWLAYFVLASGETVGERIAPQLELARRSDGEPALLLADEKGRTS